SLTVQSSFPVFDSKARKRLSEVEPMNIRPPAVAIAPALFETPVCCLSGGRISVIPSGTSQAKSPVAAFTAIRRPHGGLKHGRLPSDRPLGSRTAALKPPIPRGPVRIYGTRPSVLSGVYFGFFSIHPTAGASFVLTKMYPSLGSTAVPPQFAPPVKP